MTIGMATAFAAPAAPISQEFAQPSGETFSAELQGDEWFHWLEAEGGYVVTKGDDEYWYYSILSNDTVVASTAKYKIDAKPDGALTGKALAAMAKSKIQRANTNFSTAAQNSITLPQNQKLLVILVDFTNIQIQYESKWASEFFGTGGKSVNDYFSGVSGGKTSIVPVEESYGTSNDGIVRVSLNYAHPNTADSSNISPNVQVVKDALSAANGYVNYASFDTNGDKTIEPTEMHLVVILAGYEYSYDSGVSSPSVWGHQYTAPVTLDGVTVGTVYTQEGERHGTHQATIGIFCHELGHSMGLPDLYDCDNSSMGVGEFSLMGSGNWGRASGSEYYGATPSRLDAWSLQDLGFYTPATALNGDNAVNSSESSNGYNILKVPTNNTKEYFLIENREFTGQDASLKSYAASGGTGGIAIWHIDESVGDAVSWYRPEDNESHKAIDLEEADQGLQGRSLLDSNIATGHNSLFRTGSSVNNLFGPASNPSNLTYGLVDPEFSLEVKSAAGNDMNVNISYSGMEAPKLSSLTVSAGGTPYTLSQEFSADTLAYTVQVPFGTTSVTIAGVSETAGAIVEGAGDKAITQDTSAYTVTVSNSGRTASTQYQITVNRSAGSANNTLLRVDASYPGGTGTLTASNSWSILVPNSVSSINLTPVAEDPVATVTGGGSKSLNIGNNAFAITVKAQNGETKEYTLHITRSQSSDVSLKSVVLTYDGISREFSLENGVYNITVPYSATSGTLSAEATEPGATISGMGPKSLSYGENRFTLTVIATDGSKAYYTVIVVREPSQNVSLSSVTISYSGDAVALTMDSNGTYNGSVPYYIESGILNATASEPGASVSGTGVKNFAYGNNQFVITVTAPGGNRASYAVIVARGAVPSNRLVGITTTSGATLSPEFNPNVMTYTVRLSENTSSTTISAVVASSKIKATVNSKTTKYTVKLSPGGSKKIYIKLYSGRSVIATYTINVVRDKISNANLSYIKSTTKSNVLSPGFSAGVTDYTILIPAKARSAGFNLKVAESHAKVTINGRRATSCRLSFKAGSYVNKTVTIVVTAQNGGTKTYYVTFRSD